LREKLALLPRRAGIYIFRDSRGRVLYVGKAKRLHLRVRSYFRGPMPPDPRLSGLRRRIRSLDWIVTTSEVEALILEDSLIKQYAPRFNIRLKDDKRFPYIKVILGHPFPRLVLTRQVVPDGSRYYGPYTRVRDLRRVLNVLKPVFRLRTCSDRRLADGRRECLQYFIGRCSAPCTRRVEEASYRHQVEPLLAFLEGRGEEVIAALRGRMLAAAEELRFEDSARLRDDLALLSDLLGEQSLTAPTNADADAVGLAFRGDTACAFILHLREGQILGKHHRLLGGVRGADPSEVLRRLLLGIYLHARHVPARILVRQAPGESPEVEAALRARHEGAVEIRPLPSRGGAEHLLKMAEENAHLVLEEEELRVRAARAPEGGDGPGGRSGRGGRVDRSVYDLQEALGLSTPPYRIEGYDISNIQASHPVASRVVFQDGKPCKSEYRRYRMARREAPNDFAMMSEVVRRRLARLAEHPQSRPDLILIDGGRGQLEAALESARSLGLGDLPMVGLAKREEELILPDRFEPLRLPRRSLALRLLQRVRDEAHRFAVQYHRHLRARGQERSRLDGVPGIGPARRRALLRQFGSLQAMRAAGVEAVAAVPGIGDRLAQVLWRRLFDDQA